MALICDCTSQYDFIVADSDISAPPGKKEGKFDMKKKWLM